MNNSKLAEIIERIKTHISILQRYINLQEEEILNDIDKVGSMRYYLEVIIEDCINIGNHIISEKRFRVPKSYKDVFQILFENSIISEDLSLKLKEAAGLRNIIVHLYWKVDDKKILNFIKNNLNIFENFINYILKSIKI